MFHAQRIQKAIFVFTFLIFLSSQAVNAQNEFDLSALSSGDILLNISATEQIDVDHNTVLTSLIFQAETHLSSEAQDKVNQAIAKGLRILKTIENIEFSTGTYTIHQYKPPRNAAQLDANGKAIRWRARQSIEIESEDFDAALKAVGSLQNVGFLASGLTTIVSPPLHAKTQDTLMESALAKLKERAKRAANALDKNDFHFLEVNVQPSGHAIRPSPMMARGMHMESMAASSVAAPSVESGKSTIALMVSARVIIR